MNKEIRLFIGIFIALIGIVLVIFSQYSGLALVVLGIIIIFNKNEQVIEQRKDLNKS